MLCHFQALHQMWCFFWQTHHIAVADVGEEGHDKETWAPLLMTLSRFI